MKSSGEVKVFLGIVVVAALLVGITVYATSRGPASLIDAPQPGTIDARMRNALLTSNAQVIGDPKAPFALIEFGDFECGTCRTSEPEVRKLIDKYKSRMVYAFHHMKVMPAHVHSHLMAKAAEAAGRQGKYWEMHRKLYEAQDDIHEEDLPHTQQRIEKIARSLKLDMQRFTQFVNGDTGRKLVIQQDALADAVAIHSTPTFIFIRPDGKSTTLTSVVQATALLDTPSAWQVASDK